MDTEQIATGQDNGSEEPHNAMTPAEDRKLAEHWDTLEPRFKVEVVATEYYGYKNVEFTIFHHDMPSEEMGRLLGGITNHPCATSQVEDTFSAAEVGLLLDFFGRYKDLRVLVRPASPPTRYGWGIGMMSIGKGADHHMFFKADGYSLPFKVKGFFDLRHHDLAQWRLQIQRCVAEFNDPCAICGRRTDTSKGFALYLGESNRIVCWECGRKHEPDLVDLLEVHRSMRGIASRLMNRYRRQDEEVVAEDLPLRGS